MSKLGKLTVGPPSQHLVNGVVTADNADAVAMVYLYGSRGGFKDAQLIGQEDAKRCARQLAERAGISAPDDLPYSVGVTSSCERLARFADAVLAAQFISTLPDHESGIYFLDGPEIPA